MCRQIDPELQKHLSEKWLKSSGSGFASGDDGLQRRAALAYSEPPP